MIQNKLRVLLQRVYNGGRKPKRIVLPTAWREMLREEMRGSARYVANTFPKDDLFCGVPVSADKSINEPLILLESANAPTEKPGLILPDAPGSIGPYQPKWKKRNGGLK